MLSLTLAHFDVRGNAKASLRGAVRRMARADRLALRFTFHVNLPCAGSAFMLPAGAKRSREARYEA
jgi:hypothetical protein